MGFQFHMPRIQTVRWDEIIKGCLRLLFANTLKTRKKPIVCEQDLNKWPQAQELKQTETVRTWNEIGLFQII